MIVVHHLNDSRSQRILWLLEELGQPYEIKHYFRDPATRLAPPELKAVHPLGKSPVLTDGDLVFIESGAIVDYLIRTYGAGRFAPPVGCRDYDVYQQWLHFSEGSAMLPLLLKLYVSRLGEAGAPLWPRIESEIDNHLSFLNNALEGHSWLMGEQFSGADMQMSFVGEVSEARANLPNYPHLEAWVRRFRERPAYKRAIERGGPFQIPR